MTAESVAAPNGTIDESLARALLRSLTRGTALGDGASYIHVGHTQWLAAQAELLAEIAEDGHADTKFVRGAYGAGKSHFLSIVQDAARRHNWITAHVECKADGVQIDRFETLYPRITSKLDASDIAAIRRTGGPDLLIDPVRHLLEKWATPILAKCGVREGAISRPFDAEDRLYSQLQTGLMRSSLAPDFTKALCAFARAQLNRDFEVTSSVCEWLRGSKLKVRIPAIYVRKPDLSHRPIVAETFDLHAIGKGNSQEVMRGLLWLVRAAGYAGLVLCIDEVEELAKLGNRKRQDQALQALREYVDSAGGDGGYRHLCMYLAATPEMFEGPSYFPRYDALATRIQPIGTQINWRAPVIDLDRTPLDAVEMQKMATRIWSVYQKAYGSDSAPGFSDALLEDFVAAVVKSRFSLAKPRLLARMVVDELERARQAGASYNPPADLAGLIGQIAERVKREADK